MKLIKHGVCLALIGTGLAVSPIAQTSAGAAPAPDDLLAQMRDDARGTTAVTRQQATGKVGMIRTTAKDGDLLPGTEGASAAAAADKAGDYLDTYAAAFGARAGELTQVAASGDDVAGWTITYHQEYRGLRVFGAALKANVDTDGDLTSVNGYVAPGLDLGVSPRVDEATARDRALASVKADPPGADRGAEVDLDGVEASDAELIVYREGAVRGVRGDNLLVWYVEVGNGANIADAVFVDATTGKPVNRYSLVHDDLERNLYEETYSPASLVWAEGDPFPGALSEWQQSEVTSTGESYWLFQNTFGRDSYDGEGHTMETVNNDPRINCPNANWNGITTNYCDGTATDDVVAHEWGHAYTEYTGGLIYQWQQGALNESYSDVWGETLDLINNRDDDEEGDIDAKRPDGQCSTHSPAVPVVEINAPASIEKICDAGAASFGPAVTGAGITGDVALGTTAGGSTEACEAITSDVAGKLALVDRGTCGFTVKVKNAQDAGAVGVLVADNVESFPPGMSGADPTITIPSVRIRLSDGTTIKGALANDETVNVTMRDLSSERTDSYRWLIGEDATAFDGAIRDMWTPTCYGMPGKVSDAQYYCASGDAGGVHSNSGVPNHAYALLVDGGDYNGQSVTGIGLDKAANIWWRAQVGYQTPTTNFTEHADNLTAACADLTGKDVTKLSVAENADPGTTTITAADCTQVQGVIDAVELRKEPVQCNYQPLLDQDTPALCGSGFTTDTVWSEDFEDGLAGWDTDQEVVYPGASGFPWESIADGPEGARGKVAYGPADGAGVCDGSASDASSSDSIISPVVQLPTKGLRNPKLSFRHSVVTEIGVDGGNVEVSVNGGDYTVVPTDAYTFNAPGELLTEAEGNTNPMAGEDAFSGTDGGEVSTKWGTSIVNLSALGVRAGDTLQFKFDVGRDGCGGLFGWYVDDVKVTTCKAKTKVTATHKPDPSKVNKPSKVIAKVGRDGTSGERPDGRVVVKKGSKVLAQGRLVDGRVSLTLKARSLPVGKHQTKVIYLGNGTYARAQTSLVIKIKK